MTINQLIERITKPTLQRVIDLQTRKGSDYSDSTGEGDTLANLKACEILGITAEQGVLVRMLDKIMRVNQLHNGAQPKVVDEKIDDTTMDLITYSILLRALLHERQNKILEKR